MADTWVRLRLDVVRCDRAAFTETVDRCRRDGVSFTTIAELGEDDANCRRLCELNRECSADIRGRGEFFSYPEYLAERIEVPSYDADGVVLASGGSLSANPANRW